MRTLVHLSDLHFGRVDKALLDPLVARVEGLSPDLVVISGDLTQRARTSQFEEAAAFLARLPCPQLVVPGNHDVPLYNVLARFLWPLRNYRRYIQPDLSPCYIDAEIAVLGVNTARSMVFKNGRISQEQVAKIKRVFAPLHDDVMKVVVTHHPFDAGPDGGKHDLVGRAGMAMRAFAECGVDLLLSGHFHVSHSDDSGDRYALAGYEALVVSAGTATSTRARGESNSFNVLRLSSGRVEVERQAWHPETASYEAVERDVFERSGKGWVTVEEAKL
jgi:3',5'-cyclic AMP phosphodiesterase CpdA